MTDRPEILDEAAIADDERALVRRGPVDLLQVPRLVGNALADIRTIAEGMAVLPKLLGALNGIRGDVRSLDDEVKQMRAAVEEMRGDVNRVAHPLRRRTDGRRGRGDAGAS